MSHLLQDKCELMAGLNLAVSSNKSLSVVIQKNALLVCVAVCFISQNLIISKSE